MVNHSTSDWTVGDSVAAPDGNNGFPVPYAFISSAILGHKPLYNIVLIYYIGFSVFHCTTECLVYSIQFAQFWNFMDNGTGHIAWCKLDIKGTCLTAHLRMHLLQLCIQYFYVQSSEYLDLTVH